MELESVHFIELHIEFPDKSSLVGFTLLKCRNRIVHIKNHLRVLLNQPFCSVLYRSTKSYQVRDIQLMGLSEIDNRALSLRIHLQEGHTGQRFHEFEFFFITPDEEEEEEEEEVRETGLGRMKFYDVDLVRMKWLVETHLFKEYLWWERKEILPYESSHCFLRMREISLQNNSILISIHQRS